MVEILLIVACCFSVVALVVVAVDFVVKADALFGLGVWLSAIAWTFGLLSLVCNGATGL